MSAEIKLRLHRSMYMAQAIKDAIGIFEDFARFEMKRQDDHYNVDIHDIDPEVDGDLAGEFCNFALAHTIERKRKTPK
ncbi:MAG: hypothetical protein CMH53_10740 [Myxococcales bacterium]|nr:hypothetical protein [Myxococcales bacterium]